MADHHKADALDLIRTDLQLFLRTYKRRVQKDAEAHYELLESRAARDEAPFDHLAAARESLQVGLGEWLGVSSPLSTVEGKALER